MRVLSTADLVTEAPVSSAEWLDTRSSKAIASPRWRQLPGNSVWTSSSPTRPTTSSSSGDLRPARPVQGRCMSTMPLGPVLDTFSRLRRLHPRLADGGAPGAEAVRRRSGSSAPTTTSFASAPSCKICSFWILNDVVWRKTNPMPNFRGRRFTNAHETMIWASRDEQRQGLHLQLRRHEDGERRRRRCAPTGYFPLCSGGERHEGRGRQEGRTRRRSPKRCCTACSSSSTKPGDVVLDPFFGTGTTGAVAKKLWRAISSASSASRTISTPRPHASTPSSRPIRPRWK